LIQVRYDWEWPGKFNWVEETWPEEEEESLPARRQVIPNKILTIGKHRGTKITRNRLAYTGATSYKTTKS